MRRESIDFADTDTALLTVRAITQTFDEAVSQGDLLATRAAYLLLADAIVGVTRLIERRGIGLGSHSMGAAFPPDAWKDMAPDEIIRDLQNLVAIEELAITVAQAKVRGAGTAQAKRLSGEIARMIRSLRGRVKAAKAWILKHWPDHWTETEESDFGSWL